MIPAANRHAEATHKAILAAAVDLFRERHSDRFSVQEVADRAGLTHRTVYRYFPTRQALMAATAQQLGAPGAGEEHFSNATKTEEWIAALGPHLARIEENLEIARNLLVAVLTSDDLQLFNQDLHGRDSHRWQIFRRQFPRLPERDARRTFATLRHLTSSASYVLLRHRFGLPAAEATKAIQSGASQILEHAARRNRAAARWGRRR